MAVRGGTSSWRWNYFVEETNDIAKCTKCDENFPIEKQTHSARIHLEKYHNDNEHRSVSSNHSSEDWESQFTTQNNEMKCKHCGITCNIFKVFTERMKNHLNNKHDINEDKFIKIITNTYDKIYDQNQKEIHRCKKCGYTCTPKNNHNTLINHLLDCCQSDIPAEIRPANLSLPNSSSSTSRNVSENTAGSHLRLEKIHEMDKNKRANLAIYIFDEIYDIKKDGNNCKKCHYTFPDYDFNNIIKHSMDNHESDIPAEIRPDKLPNISSSSNTNVDEDTAASCSHW